MPAVSVLSEGISSSCQGSRVDMIIFLYNNVKMKVREGREHHFWVPQKIFDIYQFPWIECLNANSLKELMFNWVHSLLEHPGSGSEEHAWGPRVSTLHFQE